jgi:hypothetical protein
MECVFRCKGAVPHGHEAHQIDQGDEGSLLLCSWLWLELFRVKSMCMECLCRYMRLFHMAIMHIKLIRLRKGVFFVCLVVVGALQG